MFVCYLYGMEDDKRLLEKLDVLLPILNEQQKRIFLAAESIFLGRGGKTRIEKLAGVSHNTINKGIKEIESGKPIVFNQQLRKEGGGRKRKITKEVWSHIERSIEPHIRGEPQSPLQWVSKSLSTLSLIFVYFLA